jgi:hypothetical protein
MSKKRKNNGDEEKRKEERGLTHAGESPPSIPDESIHQVIKLSDDLAIWAKLVVGGFQFANQDKIVPEIIGTLVQIQPYLINFDAGDRLPAKKPHVESDLDIPEGYSRRCDIKLLTSGQVVGISLAPSSMKFQLSPYLKYLRNQGLRPEEVLTRVTSRQVSNNMGTFQVAVFEVADGEPEKVEVLNNRPEKPSGSPSPQTAEACPPQWG